MRSQRKPRHRLASRGPGWRDSSGSPHKAQGQPSGLQGQAQEEDSGGRAALGLPGSHRPVRKLQAEPFWTQSYFNTKMAVPAPWNPASLESGQGKRLSQPRKHTAGPGRRTCQPPGTDTPPGLGGSLMGVTRPGGMGLAHPGGHRHYSCSTSHGPSRSKESPQTAHRPSPPSPSRSPRCRDSCSIPTRTRDSCSATCSLCR